AVALKERADDDVAAIREWSKAEMARIKAETGTRITTRRAELVRQAQDHATETVRYMAEVKASIAAFETEMERFFEIVLAEDDPARLATLAERLPEPPMFVRSSASNGIAGAATDSTAAPTRATGTSRPRSTTAARRRSGSKPRAARSAPRLAPAAAAAAEAEAIAGLDDA